MGENSEASCWSFFLVSVVMGGSSIESFFRRAKVRSFAAAMIVSLRDAAGIL